MPTAKTLYRWFCDACRKPLRHRLNPSPRCKRCGKSMRLDEDVGPDAYQVAQEAREVSLASTMSRLAEATGPEAAKEARHRTLERAYTNEERLSLEHGERAIAIRDQMDDES